MVDMCVNRTVFMLHSKKKKKKNCIYASGRSIMLSLSFLQLVVEIRISTSQTNWRDVVNKEINALGISLLTHDRSTILAAENGFISKVTCKLELINQDCWCNKMM